MDILKRLKLAVNNCTHDVDGANGGHNDDEHPKKLRKTISQFLVSTQPEKSPTVQTCGMTKIVDDILLFCNLNVYLRLIYGELINESFLNVHIIC